MRWLDIEKKALSLNIKNPNRYSKTDLIRTIQKTEGNSECFNTAVNLSCTQAACYWRSDCQKKA